MVRVMVGVMVRVRVMVMVRVRVRSRAADRTFIDEMACGVGSTGVPQGFQWGPLECLHLP